jgi:pimeloyl-ACP methyl ester carboxylesterase
LANSPINPQFFDSFDGERLAWRETGEGRPLVLIHGFFSDAHTNWIRYGHAATIAAAGFRVIMPDLRAHGSSAKPHEAIAYPPDVLMRDGLALIEHLGLSDYDLGGYSLGARTTMRMLVNGAKPRRAILSGMGLTGVTKTEGRGSHFRIILTNLGTFKQGTPEWLAEAFLKTTKGDPIALLGILDTFVNTPIEAIQAIEQPVLVLSGDEDGDNGSARELTEALPHGTYREIPGTHMSAVLRPELGQEMVAFLTA